MRTRTSLGVLVAGSVMLVACGGSSAGDPAGGLPVPADGPVPTLPVSESSASASPLPDVAIRRINGDGGWAQFKDLLPADRPLLVWFWAPH